jgi:hypothetical protein
VHLQSVCGAVKIKTCMWVLLATLVKIPSKRLKGF